MGAADIPVELIRVRKSFFERILTGYGLTEAGTVTGRAMTTTSSNRITASRGPVSRFAS